MEIITGGITAPQGFRAAGAACGIKKRKKDVALVVSDTPCTVAGAFTTNLVKAAPVLWDKKIVDTGAPVRALVVNSGNANACTGDKGYEDTCSTAAFLSHVLSRSMPPVSPEEILVCSTGVIGVPLPMENLFLGIEDAAAHLGSDDACAEDAASAILTTDTTLKTIAVRCTLEKGGQIVLGGMAKGSGMIHPNLATMLSFVTTDASLSSTDLQKLLGHGIQDTFNMISVDGDTSTNDTLLVLANGASGLQIEQGTADWDIFSEAFLHVLGHLAREIVRDGEGGGHFVEVTVTGAETIQDARLMARSVISSSLVKTAFFGADANWGRILCAMGYSGARFNPGSVSLWFSSAQGSLQVVEKGMPLAFDEEVAKKILLEKDVKVLARLADGEASAMAWGCDLSYEYVRINGDYRS